MEPIPQHVLIALDEVRASGQTNMLDSTMVLLLADDWGHARAVDWLRLNQDRYMEALRAMGTVGRQHCGPRILRHLTLVANRRILWHPLGCGTRKQGTMSSAARRRAAENRQIARTDDTAPEAHDDEHPDGKTAAPLPILEADEPIANIEQDQLGRAPFARALASSILRAPTHTGFVVALAGPWGSGKTSVVNMARQLIESEKDKNGQPRFIVLEFNPWLFADTEQLVARFFTEISAQLKEKRGKNVKKIGEHMAKYGDIVSHFSFVPIAGDALDLVGKSLAGGGKLILGSTENVSLESERNSLRDTLNNTDKEFLIIVDDIDRLDDIEISTVMRLVKLSGNFPRIIYLLALDRERVEPALEASYGRVAGSGRKYLEKIVQVIYDIPHINETKLSEVLATSINRATHGDHGQYDESELNLIYKKVILPLCNDIRAVKRYCNGLPMAIDSVAAEVNLTDVLALEALRVTTYNSFALLPDLMNAVQESISALDGSDREAENRARQLAIEVVGTAGPRGQIVQRFLRYIFPTAASVLRDGRNTFAASSYSHWRRDRRVVHPEVFRFYLERTFGGDGLSVRQVEELFESLTDGARLRKLLDDLDASLVVDALGRLEVYESDFPTEGMSDAVAALMDQTPRLYQALPVRVWEDPSSSVKRIVLRLLRRVDPASQRVATVSAAFDEVQSVAGKCLLVELVGFRENSGHGLISRTDAAALDRRASDAVRSLTPGELAREPNLGELMDFVFYVDQSEGRAWNSEQIRDPSVLIALLRSSRSENVSSDGVHTERLQVLLWDRLVRMVDEDTLETDIKRLPESDVLESIDPESREVVDLALKYADGWRPPNPFGANRVAATFDATLPGDEGDSGDDDLEEFSDVPEN